PLLFFHLCYHKAEQSGIPTGTALPTGTAKRDYSAKLLAECEALGAPFAEAPTLLALHEALARLGWDMQLDLLVRWPIQSPWIRHLTERARERYARLAEIAPELIVFVLR